MTNQHDNPLTAIDALREGQRQLDEDGVEVGVSRQALEETLSILDDRDKKIAELETENAHLTRDSHRRQANQIKSTESAEKDYQGLLLAANEKIAELEAALRVAREAIESLPADALGTATPIDAYPYPIRDEVINTISQALKGEGDA